LIAEVHSAATLPHGNRTIDERVIVLRRCDGSREKAEVLAGRNG
jgi:hypothetical protein